LELSNKLEENPKLGTSLWHNVYKVRLKNSDINRGKSNGYRVITYLIDEDNEVRLITIYSKSERENILDFEIKEIIEKENKWK
jgi:mRNA-degrading endonuclease RelE of RelBE toxin-antitoxin system